jgi:hypothetical protein
MSIIKFPTKEDNQTVKEILESNLNQVDDINDIIILKFLKDDTLESNISDLGLRDILWAIKRLEHKILMFDSMMQS